MHGEKTSSLTIETLIAETDASDIILQHNIGSGAKSAVLPPTFTTTFVVAAEQQPHIEEIGDSTTLLTDSLGVEQSLFKKDHLEQEQILKCSKVRRYMGILFFTFFISRNCIFSWLWKK